MLAVVTVLMGGGLFYGCFVGITLDSKPGDRELLLTVDDVIPDHDFSKDSSRETLTRKLYLDGTRELFYEYDGSDGEPAVYISSQLTRAVSKRDATAEYLGMKATAPAAFLIEGLTATNRDDWFRWGEDSTSLLLSVPEGDVGHMFFARRGDRVFLVSVTGLLFDEPGALEALLRPRLERGAAAKL